MNKPPPTVNTSWMPINTAKKELLQEIDVWLTVPASPMSMGIGDSFRVPDAYWMEEQPKQYRNTALRDDYRAGWFHMHDGKHRRLNSDYITHWMPIPQEP